MNPKKRRLRFAPKPIQSSEAKFSCHLFGTGFNFFLFEVEIVLLMCKLKAARTSPTTLIMSFLTFWSSPVWPDVGTKNSPFFPKVAQNIASPGFSWKWCFKKAQKVTMHFGYFCMNIGHRELSKIAQSGHTDRLSPHEGRGFTSTAFGFCSVTRYGEILPKVAKN